MVLLRAARGALASKPLKAARQSPFVLWSPTGTTTRNSKSCAAGATQTQASEQCMSNRETTRIKGENLASHILPVSGTMIGVCATLIGLVKLAEAKHGSSHVDEYAALAAVTFLASALTSYLSIRYADRTELSFHIERVADAIFLCGLIGITIVATLFAYEVI
jgi:hypothetical protein